MSAVAKAEAFENILTGKVGWAITPKHSTEPALEGIAELTFIKNIGSILFEDVLYSRFPGDSSHQVTLRADLRPYIGAKVNISGALEVTGPRQYTSYRRYVGNDEGRAASQFPRKIGETTWYWRQTGSWRAPDINPETLLTLPDIAKRHPDVEPLDPSDVCSRVLLAAARKL